MEKTVVQTLKSTPVNENLISEWQDEHRHSIVKRAMTIAFIFMSAMLPLDFVFFPISQAITYTPFRIFFLIFLTFEYFAIASKNIFFQKLSGNQGNYTILRVVILISGFYNYFLFSCPPQYSNIITWGNIIVVAAGSTLVHQLNKTQLYYHVGSISLAIGFGVLCLSKKIVPNNVDFVGGVFHIALYHVFFLFFFKMIQIEFYRSLTVRFNSLCQILPLKIARHMTVKDISIEEDEYLKPRLLKTVCLCSDWRDYQKMAMREDPETMSKIFETYYDLVFKKLEEAAPSGNYFVDWTADELIVIFYDENNDEINIKKEALSFAKVLASDILSELDKKGIHLIYDIGLCFGEGFLGLQGPKGKKKTTITGEVAGIAKRLQTEAKEMRAFRTIESTPLVFINETLKAFVDINCKESFPSEDWYEWEAKSKNIKGSKSYYWQMESSESSILLLSS